MDVVRQVVPEPCFENLHVPKEAEEGELTDLLMYEFGCVVDEVSFSRVLSHNH